MSNLGEIANVMHGGVTGATSMVKGICIIVGAGMLLGGAIKWQARRQNPAEVSLWTIIFLVLFGVALIALGFVPKWNNEAKPAVHPQAKRISI